MADGLTVCLVCSQITLSVVHTAWGKLPLHCLVDQFAYLFESERGIFFFIKSSYHCQESPLKCRVELGTIKKPQEGHWLLTNVSQRLAETLNIHGQTKEMKKITSHVVTVFWVSAKQRMLFFKKNSWSQTELYTLYRNIWMATKVKMG